MQNAELRSRIGSKSVGKCGEIIMSKKPINPDELKKASEALHYELWMLNECVNLYEENKNRNDKRLENAIIESFCVHARSLLDFFCDPKPWEDDIFYEDFLKLNPNNKFTSSFTTIDLKVTNDNLNECLAHLSYKRINKKIKWEISKITNEINENMRNFLKAVNPSLICDELKSFYNCFTSQYPNSVHTTSDAIISYD